MSLDFSTERCKDLKEKYPDIVIPVEGREEPIRQWNPVTYCLIWGTMAVDIGQITEKNYSEFFRRLHVWIDEIGSITSTADGPVRPTLADVKAHIGLSSNVVTTSARDWAKRVEKVKEWDRPRRATA